MIFISQVVRFAFHGATCVSLLDMLFNSLCSASYEKFRISNIGKSELRYTEIPNNSNKKIRIDIVSAFERRYTFINGYK